MMTTIESGGKVRTYETTIGPNGPTTVETTAGSNAPSGSPQIPESNTTPTDAHESTMPTTTTAASTPESAVAGETPAPLSTAVASASGENREEINNIVDSGKDGVKDDKSIKSEAKDENSIKSEAKGENSIKSVPKDGNKNEAKDGNNRKKSSGMSSGAKVGIVAAVVAGAAILGLLVYFALFRSVKTGNLVNPA